uniref:C-type lectin domain family 10 member A-like n=1 Tax=Pristiophorus japonicus TaxID=55135 RepID=UPI00398EDFAD
MQSHRVRKTEILTEQAPVDWINPDGGKRLIGNCKPEVRKTKRKWEPAQYQSKTFSGSSTPNHSSRHGIMAQLDTQPADYENVQSLPMVEQQEMEGKVETQGGEGPEAKLYRWRNVLMVTFGLFILLLLVVGLVKISGIRSEMEELRGNLLTQLSQVKSNASEMNKVVEEFQSQVQMQVSQALVNVSGIRSEMEELRGNFPGQKQRFHLPVRLDACSCPQCPSDWLQYNQACYYFSTKEGSWQKAKQDCALKDSHMIVINSIVEQNFMTREIKPKMYWIGLSDISDEGSWKWDDGTSYSSTPKFWAAGEPNNAGNREDCAHTNDKGQWNDNLCTAKLPWICERRNLSA